MDTSTSTNIEVTDTLTEVSALPDLLSIGQVAQRSGIAHTALRFYEDRELINSTRTTGNQRRYHRSVLRRLAFIKAAQRVGVSLEDIHKALETLPHDHAPTRKDWARLSSTWHEELNTRIDALTRLRDRLTGCIGCGCLSLRTCALQNQDDHFATAGPGAPRLAPLSEGGL